MSTRDVQLHTANPAGGAPKHSEDAQAGLGAPVKLSLSARRSRHTPAPHCEGLTWMHGQCTAQAAHRALTDVRVRLRGRALAMPVEGLGWMRLLATITTSFPENFFSNSRTRRGCTFWKAFSSR